MAGCRKRESDLLEERPWWEPPYVVYGFSNPRVKKTLEDLMGSHLVRATDREYMQRLQQRMREHHVDSMRRRIAERARAEVEREKRLMLEGKAQMEELPSELLDHPVVRITRLVEKVLKEARLKEELKKRPRKVKTFDYSLLQDMEEEKVDNTDLVGCLEEGAGRDQMRKRLREVEETIEQQSSELFTDEDFLRIKYMDPLVEELMEAETVDELYEIADEVVGLLSGKPCGALIKRV